MIISAGHILFVICSDIFLNFRDFRDPGNCVNTKNGLVRLELCSDTKT